MVFFTKADKIAASKRRELLRRYVREGLRSEDVPVVTSAPEGAGIEEARTFLRARVLAAAAKSAT
jgi:GTP-binding protein